MTFCARFFRHVTTARRAHRLAVLCALAIVILSPRAHAVAPMCDPSGASVAAPPPALPNATGELAAPINCDDAEAALDFGDAAKPTRDTPPPVRASSTLDRMMPAAFVWPDLRGELVPQPATEVPEPRFEFSDPVYRPPRQ
jgi:hypothetical protein